MIFFFLIYNMKQHMDIDNDTVNEIKNMVNPAPRFDPAPVASFLCNHIGVSDVRYIVPFGKRTHAWEVMRESHIKVEVGTVKKGNADPQVYGANIETRTLEAAEKQALTCLLDPKQPYCRYLDKIQPKKPFVHPVTQQPMIHGMEKACIFNVVVRHQLSSVPIKVATRLNYVHTGLDQTEALSEHYQLYEDAGGIKGAFMHIEATKKEGKDCQCIPIHATGFGPCNKEFVRTMALINDSNLMNGIIKIPGEVCKAAGLPIFNGFPGPEESLLVKYMEQLSLRQKDIEDAREQREYRKKMGLSDPEPMNTIEEEEEDIDMEAYKQAFIDETKKQQEERHKDDQFIKFYYALPINHVLAWPLQSEDYARGCGFRSEQFRFKNPDTGKSVILYFLVGDCYMDLMVKWFREKFMNMVDVRPLNSVGFEFVPMLNGDYPDIPAEKTRVAGVLRIRAHIDYMTAPAGLNNKTISELAPALSPAFPRADQWSVDEQTKEMLADAYQRQQLEKLDRNKQKSKQIK